MDKNSVLKQKLIFINKFDDKKKITIEVKISANSCLTEHIVQDLESNIGLPQYLHDYILKKND